MSPLIDSLKQFYASACLENLNELETLYSDDVEFVDPIHRIQGIDALRTYFENMYRNIVSCTFEYKREVVTDDTLILQWTMCYRHARLANGQPLRLNGISMLSVKEGKVVRHEDFYDMGAMIYERIPVIGWFVRKIKARLVL